MAPISVSTVSPLPRFREEAVIDPHAGGGGRWWTELRGNLADAVSPLASGPVWSYMSWAILAWPGLSLGRLSRDGTGPGGRQADAGALGHQAVLELGDGAQDQRGR